MENKIKTKYGNVSIKQGYYYITNKKEGNYGKALHRVIWEEWYGKKIPENYDIHHLNRNKLDNRIQNLQCVSHKNHIRFHSSHRPKEVLKKISENSAKIWEGKQLSENHKRNVSKSHSTTGYYHIHKEKSKSCKQGFIWRYQYLDENGKKCRISSVDFNKLKEKVKEKGLEWEKLF